jgi:AraC-like DNA-binding protein
VRFAGPIAHPLIGMLPKVLLLHREDLERSDGWLDGTLTMLEAEALALRPGGAALMIHLADILVLQTIRVWLERNETRQVGWIRALTDPEIGPVLAVIHRCPEEAWTLTSLAAEAHLSRSAFTERFTRLVGMPPMHYVAQWQMHLASSWLREGRLSPSEVGHRLGYSSEAAFSRAFKRHLHLPPGAVQRRK